MHPATIRGAPLSLARLYGSGVQNSSLRTRPVWAFLLDAVCILAFAAGGRSSHEEAISLGGVAHTAWPFLVGLGACWLALLLANLRAANADVPVTAGAAAGTPRRRDHLAPFPAGLAFAVSSWGLGMWLRQVTGDTTSGAFPIVALAFLTFTLVGWRVVATLVSRRARRRSSVPTP